jgi:hypothetical protein
MSETVYFIIGFGMLILIGVLMLLYLNQCPHHWKLIKEYDIVRVKNEKIIGGGKIYECYHCKKIKKEEFKI